MTNMGDKAVRTWNECAEEGFEEKIHRESEYRWNRIRIYGRERDD